VTEFLRTFGPWGLVLLAMAWLLKVMVTDKLKTIQTTLDGLVSGQKDHGDRIVAIETTMRINGCGDGEPRCRRKGDQL